MTYLRIESLRLVCSMTVWSTSQMNAIENFTQFSF